MQQASWVDVLHSRKFWALVIALLAIVAGYATGQLDAWQAIQAAVAALAAYSTGIAIEDAGAKVGAGKTSSPALLHGMEKGAEPADVPAGTARLDVVQSTSGITGPPLPDTAGLPTSSPALLHEMPLQGASRAKGAEKAGKAQ